MLKMLICKIRDTDGTEYTVRTYADDHILPRIAMWDIIPLRSKIISHEWIDTLTERRKQWNLEHPECPISLDS